MSKLTKPEVWIVVPDIVGNAMLVARSDDVDLIREVQERCGSKWEDSEGRWSERKTEAHTVDVPVDKKPASTT